MMEMTLRQAEGGGKVVQHRRQTDDVIGNADPCVSWLLGEFGLWIGTN